MFRLNKKRLGKSSTEQQITARQTKAVHPTRHDSTNEPLQNISFKPKSKWNENLIIHYAHEARLTNYKRDIHYLWDHIFEEMPVVTTTLIVGNLNNPNATKTLVRRRPANELSNVVVTNDRTN